MIALACGRSGRTRRSSSEVRANGSLVKGAVEETLRWAGPVGTSTRQTTRERRSSPGVALPRVRWSARSSRRRTAIPRRWHRSRSVRHPPQGGCASRVRDRDALLPRRLVRPAPGAGLARDPARAAARASAWIPSDRRRSRVGVPRARTRRGSAGMRRERQDAGAGRGGRAPCSGRRRSEPRSSLLRAGPLGGPRGGADAGSDAAPRPGGRRRSATPCSRQIDAGLDVVTDGEFRRWMFMNSFYDAVEGVRTDKVVRFRNAPRRGRRAPVHEIVERLRPVDSPAAREAALPRRRRRRPSVQGHVPGGVDLRASAHDRRGCDEAATGRSTSSSPTRSRSSGDSSPTRSTPAPRYVQFDFPLYPYLVDPVWVARFDGGRARGRTRSWSAALAADRAVLRRHPRGRDHGAPHLPRATSDRRGCARGRSSRWRSGYSASCRTTRSSSSGTTSDATAGSSPSGSCERARRW